MTSTYLSLKRPGGKTKRIEIHAPILKFLIWFVLIILFIASLPLALILWLLGLRGPFHDNEWTLDKGCFKRKSRL